TCPEFAPPVSPDARRPWRSRDPRRNHRRSAATRASERLPDGVVVPDGYRPRRRIRPARACHRRDARRFRTTSYGTLLLGHLAYHWCGDYARAIDWSVSFASRKGRLALSIEREQRGTEPRALRLLEETASHREPPEIETAEQHYRQGLALAA